ncbi:MAG: beta-lactamase family protein, partial [Planctomycetes bacterium]|nr:beta-lactamase family protein [Planctomycetota bacterium]
AHGYSDFGSGPMDMSEAANASVVGAAGGVTLVTNAEDMAQFVNAVAANQLFQESDTLAEMLTVLNMTADTPLGDIVQGYSLGLMHIDFGGGIMGIGHSGDTPGYNTFVFHLPDQNMTISGAVNVDDFSAGFVQLIPRALEVLVPGYTMAEPPVPAQPDLSAALQGLVDSQVQEQDILGMAMAVRALDGTV